MSCHGCSIAFGFLNRERGCPKCGYSYCKKCLRYKLEGNTLVCKSCHDSATTNISSSASGPASNKQQRLHDDNDIPLNFKETVQVVKAIRRLESLENPSKPPIVVYTEGSKRKPHMEGLKKGMSVEDQKLVDRLANLRNSEKSRRKSSDPAEELSQIELRLALLKDEDPAPAKNIDPLLVSKKTETEDDLLKRLGHEASLDKQYNDNLVLDIEERLGRLRQPSNTNVDPSASVSKGTGQMDVEQRDGENDEEETDDQQVQKIIDKFVAEVALESRIGGTTTHEPHAAAASAIKLGLDNQEAEAIEIDVEPSSEEDLDDDEMCRICDAKATHKCKECDGDIFCAKCFEEFHRELGEKNHKATPYKK